ncbi:hypothetical protein CAP35_00580 [Chitinophagaceae bacterium IBVUCB1]|nr:hypothetical protein CAP35_00580 [Chitinophagaceae bacterium IBVUCB1]
MKKWLILVPCMMMTIICRAQSFDTPFEKSNGTVSATYAQLIDYYERLDAAYECIRMKDAGETDAYYPLQVVYYSKDGRFNITEWKRAGKIIILINNGIHPGEPDGIDASTMLLRDAAMGKVVVPDNIILAVIPVFNIGGMLNRGSHSRANQNGPKEYGFRGNAQNLDLNRDFIKMDAKETRSLVRLFHKLSPDVLIDNHVSNGADYQHIVTLLSTQHNKLGGAMGNYLYQHFEPLIYKDMSAKGYDLVPYVNHWGHTPDNGWTAFHEGPRFASGFAAMHHTYAFVTETHMLKPFDKRVYGTYELMKSFISVASAHGADIKQARQADIQACAIATQLPVEWASDTAKKTKMVYKGYEAGYKPSDVSGQQRLYYDRNKPYTKEVVLYDTYKDKQVVTLPQAYLLSGAWHKVISRLQDNKVQMIHVDKDTIIYVGVYYIESYETTQRPYEGHYLHSKIKTRKEKRYIKLYKGDYIIPMQQPAKRFITEVLEPIAPDSYFAWGFFDAILQQKEGYSDYVFEDEAARILQTNEALRKKLEEKKASDAKFAADGDAQLDFVYKHSPYYEPVHMRYPVFRLE